MKKVKDFNQLKTFIKNQPLVQIEPTLAGLDPSLLEQKNGSVFFGTGICTQSQLSIGLPFDFLGMLLMSESLRQVIGLRQIFHQIADTHALTNDFGQDKVKEAAFLLKKKCELINRNLGLGHVQVFLASQLPNDSLRKKLSSQVAKAKVNEYVKKEVVDIEWFRQTHQVCLKIGWTIQSSEAELGNDERVFDQAHQKTFGKPISFVLLKPGRTFDKSRQKVSPYISIPGEKRLMLTKDEPVKEKIKQFSQGWEDDHWGGTRKHLRFITRLFEQLFGSLTGLSLEEKIGFIIKKSLG
ncbi:hypothetical protein ACFLZP_02720 [Patescibacteria group bacterium]